MNERRRSTTNNPGVVEFQGISKLAIGCTSSMASRRKLKLAPLISPWFFVESARQWGMELKKETRTRIFLFSMKTSSWHWSTGVPFPIGCLNLWPFRAQKHGRIISIVRSSQLPPSISVLVASTDRSSVRVCVYFLDTISREGSSARVSSSSSSLLLVEFSLYIYIYISKFDSRFDEFFHRRWSWKIDLSTS